MRKTESWLALALVTLIAVAANAAVVSIQYLSPVIR